MFEVGNWSQMESLTILQKTRERFTSCHSYQDEGIIYAKDVQGERDLQFRTTFARPSKFVFEWTEDSYAHKIGCDGLRPYSKLAPDYSLDTEDSIESAVITAASMSCLTAPLILPLLMPDKFTQAKNILGSPACRTRHEELNSETFLVFDADQETTVWLSLDSFIRRIEVKIRITPELSLEIFNLLRTETKSRRFNMKHPEFVGELEKELDTLESSIKVHDYHSYTIMFSKVLFDSTIERGRFRP